MFLSSAAALVHAKPYLASTLSPAAPSARVLVSTSSSMVSVTSRLKYSRTIVEGE